MAPPNTPQVDLVLVFRSAPASASKYLSKQETRDNASEAEAEYSRLLATLKDAGFKATGRRGQKNGQIIVLLWTPMSKLSKMVQRERHTDFLRGLPASELVSLDSTAISDPATLSPADRLRIVYEYVTSTRYDGGLGIVPGSKEWSRIESVVALHDHEFNDLWMRTWTRRQIGFGIGRVELDKIKEHFGESVALYFNFLSTYTQSLMYIGAIGTLFYFLQLPYSPYYSVLLVLYAVSFVEYWRITERKLSVRWGTRGSFRVERRRAQYEDVVGGERFPWWKRDVRILSSLPVILLFAVALAALLTAIFIFEAFVTQLYTGPGHKYVSFSPTILFVALVPRLLAVYQTYAIRLTNWENHAHQSSHEASLTLKTFALSAIVAYLGLALSAFVYVPFGEAIMNKVQDTLFLTSGAVAAHAAKASLFNDTFLGNGGKGKAGPAPSPGGRDTSSIWMKGVKKTNPMRLQGQVYAYTVTNQIIGAFLEVGLPWLQAKFTAFRASRKSGGSAMAGPSTSAASVGSAVTKKTGGKRVVFDDEEKGEKEEREFLEGVRHEVSLPEYTLFADYSEMVTQFGYVAMWSTIWTLSPVMALLNNWLELRSDAFKIAKQFRRPIPTRTDTIGPWLEAMGFITWVGTLTNTALVYLFRPTHLHTGDNDEVGTELDTSHVHTSIPLRSRTLTDAASPPEYTELVIPAMLLALAASHGFILLRVVVCHVLERLFWKGSEEERRAEDGDRRVKEQYLRSLGLDREDGDGGVEGRLEKKEGLDGLDATGFWVRDEGADEIQKAVKDA